MSDLHRVSRYVDGSRHRNLKSFIEWGIDMQFADVSDLLLLPNGDLPLHGGQNYSSAAVAVNLVAGASVWFYDSTEQGLTDRRDRSRRFKEVLDQYWPWGDGETLGREDGIRVIYDLVRNPLAHCLGLPVPTDGHLIRFSKSPLSDEMVSEVNGSDHRPNFLPATVTEGATVGGLVTYSISVPALYWGTRQIYRGLLTDETQADAAEKVASTLVTFLTSANLPKK